MKFGNLHIENFLAIGKATVNLSDRGLVLIQGENKDETSATSNGSGKSSILDALSWVLYGITARDVSGDEVVNRTAKSGTAVSVTILDGQNEFEVIRYRKHTAGKNRVELRQIAPIQQDLTGGTDKITQESIREILGCSHAVFTAAIYAGQETFPNLPSLTDKPLKVLIEEAAGIELLEAAYALAKSKHTSAKFAYDTASGKVGSLTCRLSEISDRLTAARAQVSEFEANRETLRDGHLVRAVDLEAQAMAAISGVTPELVDRIDQGIAAVSAKLAGFAALQAQERGLAQKKSMADNEAARASAGVNTKRTAASKVESGIAGISARVGTPCRECGKPYAAEDLATAKAAQEASLAQLMAELAKDADALGMREDAARGAAKELADFQATLPDVSQLTALQASLHANKNAALEHQRKSRELQAEADRAGTAAREAMLAPNPFSPILEAYLAELDVVTAARTDASLKLSEAEHNLKLYAKVSDVYSPKGVRAQVLDTVTPFLNDRTATYLGSLSDGNIRAEWSTLSKTAKGELREKFRIAVSSETGGESYKSLSGGEKRKVKLATAMALQDLVASRAVKPIELFFADEIDSAMDDAGLERLMTVLEQKARERGTVFVVSHNPLSAIRDTLVIRKSGGLSEIVE